MIMEESRKLALQLEPRNASIHILVEEHMNGTWIETGSDSWAILEDNELNELIDILTKIREKRDNQLQK